LYYLYNFQGTYFAAVYWGDQQYFIVFHENGDGVNKLTPADLGLILSYRCTAGCAHCVYNSGPERDGWMTYEDVLAAFRAMKSWEHPFQVHITGGEPFLNFPLLLHAVGTAVDYEIPVYVETSAAWCVREELVEERFQALRQAGLGAVLISCSPFHTASIPLARTQLAIRKAVEIFGVQRVIVYQQQWLELLAAFGDDPVPLEVLIDSWGESQAGDLFWNGFGLMGGGRCGVRLGSLVPGRPAEVFRGYACRHELLHAPHSHFDLHGNYVPAFCGGISIGSWYDLAGIREQAEQEALPQLVQILIKQGPTGLADLAESQGYKPCPGGYVDKCHLCVEVRRWLVGQGEYSELQPKEFYSSF
jgi:hypothetical protein